MTLACADLRVLHIGGGSYRCGDRTHSTYQIWKELAVDFTDYHVVGRSMRDACSWADGNLRVDLMASRTLREWEFLATQFAVLSRLNGQKPDVVVTQSPVSGGLAAVAISRRHGSRILMELHTDAFFTKARPGSNQWWYQKLSAWALPRATLIRVLTPSMGKKLVDLYGAHLASKIRVLPPRVDLRSFSPREGTRAPGPLRIITVGSLVERKGQVRLINALADVDFPVQLHIVGDGPHMELCRSAQQALPPHIQVKLHGSLRHDEIAELLRAADLFVLYSNSEGTPRAIMEAMAAGLPVISTDVGFCSDMIEHGTDGYLLGSNPDADLIPLLHKLAEDPAMAETMGQAALTRARRDYDSEKLYPAYRQLIAEAAAL